MSVYLYLDEQGSDSRAQSYHHIVGILQAKANSQNHQDNLSNIFNAPSFYLDLPANCSDQVVLIDKEQYTELITLFKSATKYLNKFGYDCFLESDLATKVNAQDKLITFTQEGAGLSLALENAMKPFIIDFEAVTFRKRLLSGGRKKEPVARAVLGSIDHNLKDPLIFDATAGLGTESMVLAHAGARVLSFERNIATWIILADALERAKQSRFFPFALPTLYPIGTIEDYKAKEVADFTEDAPFVVYYDPMFPESDDSARVKKGMYILQQINTSPEDVTVYLSSAVKLALSRVVLKRPQDSPLIEVNGLYCDMQIESGPCRYDCYIKATQG